MSAPNQCTKVGRPPNAPNKITRLSKDNITQAFEELGGVDGMVEWARQSNQNLTEFYRIYSKLLPRQLDVKNDGNPLSLTVVRYEQLPPPPMKTVSATVINDDDDRYLEKMRDELRLEPQGLEIVRDNCESIVAANENDSQ